MQRRRKYLAIVVSTITAAAASRLAETLLNRCDGALNVIVVAANFCGAISVLRKKRCRSSIAKNVRRTRKFWKLTWSSSFEIEMCTLYSDCSCWMVAPRGPISLPTKRLSIKTEPIFSGFLQSDKHKTFLGLNQIFDSGLRLTELHVARPPTHLIYQIDEWFDAGNASFGFKSTIYKFSTSEAFKFDCVSELRLERRIDAACEGKGRCSYVAR